MIFQKRVTYSFIFAIMILFLSFFIKFVPCQTSPNLPNSEKTWQACNLNPDSKTQEGLVRTYFGYTESLIETYLILVILSFLMAMIVLHFIARTKIR